MRPRGEAAGQADLDDRLAGLHQQLARLVQAQFQVILAGHAIEVLLEDALQLAPRDAHVLGDLVGGQRLFDIGFHQQHRLGQLGVAGAEAILQRNALTLAAFADAFDHQLLGHRAGQLGAVVTGQQSQQHIHHRHAATGGEAITVPVEQVAGGDHLGEALGEIVLPAPVHRRPIPIEQPQLRQRIDTGRHRANAAAVARHLLERRGQCRRHGSRRLVGEQEQLAIAFQPSRPGTTRQAPGPFGGLFGLQERHLVDHLRMDALGDAQGLFRQRQGQGLGGGPKQEADSGGSHDGQAGL